MTNTENDTVPTAFINAGGIDDRNRVVFNEGDLFRLNKPKTPPHETLRPRHIIKPERVTGPQLVAGDNLFRFGLETSGFEIFNGTAADFTREVDNIATAGSMNVFANTSRPEDTACSELHIFIPVGSASIGAFVNDAVKGVAIEGWE